MSSLVRGSVGAASAMFLVGTLAAVSSVIKDYPVYGGQAMRYAVGAGILFAVARTVPAPRPVRLTGGDAVLLVALAGTGLVLFNIFVIEATRHASPALVGTVIATVPLVLAVAGPALTRSRPSGQVLLAASVVVAGAVLVTGTGRGDTTGLLYAVGALACEACFSLLAVPLLPKLGAIRVSAYTMAVALPMLAIAGVISDGSAIVRMPTAAEAAGIAYLSVAVSAVGFLLWYDALGRLGADRIGLFAGILPIGAIVTTVVLGIATPTAVELAGTALVVAGLFLGLRQPGRTREVRDAARVP